MASVDKVGTLEEEGLKRKERLKALKRKLEHGGVENAESNENSKVTTLPKPKFRSYKPIDEKLKEAVIEDAKPSNVEEEVKEQLAAAHTKVVIEELDISNLAPRKPDWDLKRDVAKKLEKLERLTQRAIAELIRERLKKEAGEIDLATSVTIGVETLNKEVDE
ncbi:UNVERIFIED_CONTAM: hypothetical protein PYX00_008336 [Menopon gallinae]|uniref:Coiled-coil domain-containing protein 12 n=1 Tax=Menopon gallinae TaxID=328185 RepID=A0AAW2HNC8_9NEOP